MGGIMALSAACDGETRQGQPGAGLPELEGPGVETFDASSQFKLAGISALLDLELEPLNKQDLEGDTLGPSFHLFVSRCAACHDIPAPASKASLQWAAVVSRMRQHSRDAGLMPMSTDDAAHVLDYLERHSR